MLAVCSERRPAWGTIPAAPAKHHIPSNKAACAARAALVGIDLGTSNSTVACLRDGQAEVIPAADGGRFTPSVVLLREAGEECLVGNAALQAESRFSKDVFRSIKRVVGRRHSELVNLADLAIPGLQKNPGGEVALWSFARQANVSPEEILAILLQHLTQLAIRHLGQNITGAVITIPAEFKERQRQCIRKAAELAGLTNVQLLQEPVAAALAYGAGGSEEDENVLVFDLGGGTLDVSLLDSFEGALEVLDTDGDAHLGGNDFDQCLADWLLPRHMLHEQSNSLRSNGPAWSQMLRTAEKAKVALSSRPTVQVVLHGRDAAPVQVTLSQDDLEEATWGMRARLWAPLERLGKRSCVQWASKPPAGTSPLGVAQNTPTVQEVGAARKASLPALHLPRREYLPPPRTITKVVLVGGSSRIPWVRKFVSQITGVAPSSGVDPEECVAVGAALYAGMLSGHVKGIELTDGAYAQDLHGRSSGFPFQ